VVDDVKRVIDNNIYLAKQHGITDADGLEKISQSAVELYRKPIGQESGMYPRTQAELEALALDPANGKIKLLERNAALGCEASGEIPRPITRSADQKSDFVNANGTLWDVKSFRTDWKNGYDYNTAMFEIYGGIFNKGQNLIIDTTYLAKWARDELVAGIISNGWGQYVRFYP